MIAGAKTIEEMLTEARDALAARDAFVRARAVEECAALVDDFHWVLPMYESREVNEASDDAAEAVKEQIASALRLHANVSAVSP